MDKASLKFLEELCNSSGPSGFEKETTLVVKEYVEGFVDSMCTDKMGSLVFNKTGTSDTPAILIPGHVDEVGFIISSISPEGFLTFNPLGGWFDQVLLGQRVKVMTKKGFLLGVVASKPPHIMDPRDREKVVVKESMFIDIGASNRNEAAEMGVRIGDAVVPDSKFSTVSKPHFKDGKKAGERTLAFGKGFDDRVGAFLAAELVKTLSKKKIAHPNKIVGAATVQEEVGLRGARTVANMVKPDLAIVLDVDIAGDVPGITPSQAPTRMGEGVSITTWDASMVPNQGLKELCIELCEEKGIPYQLSHAKGGTDAGMIHLSNIGVPSIVLGVPTRHIHSHVGILDIEDIDQALKLLIELAKVLDKEKVDSFTSIGNVRCGL
jgi:putative aminopeptidase FrvX